MTPCAPDRRIRTGEIRFVVFWILVVVLAGFAPYLLGLMGAPAGSRFMWVCHFVDDQNPHLSWMRQAYEGRWLFQNLYTSEPHPPRLIFAYFLLLGWGARLLHLPLLVMYHAARVGNTVLVLAFLYVFLARLVPQPDTRRTAFLFAAVGSGFGWICCLLRPVLSLGSTVDLREPSAVLFTALMMSPLYGAAILLLLLTFGMLFAWARSDRDRYLFGAAAAVFALGLVHPYDTATAYGGAAVFLVLLCLRDPSRFPRAARAGCLLVALSIAPMLYNFYLVTADPVFGGWKDQISEGLGQPVLAAMGFGLLFLLAFYRYEGIGRLKETDEGYILPVAWVLATTILVLSPVQVQRRLLLGVQIPLAVLAAQALHEQVLPAILRSRPARHWLERGLSAARLRGLAAGCVVVLTVPTQFCVVADILYKQRALGEGYLKDVEIEAMRWLETETDRTDLVLAGYEIGNYLPRVSGNPVFIGYYQLTRENAAKRAVVNRVFSGETAAEERASLLAKHGIRYLFYGPRERRLGAYEYLCGVHGAEPRDVRPTGRPAADLASDPYLEAVFTNSSVTIYRTTQEQM